MASTASWTPSASSGSGTSACTTRTAAMRRICSRDRASSTSGASSAAWPRSVMRGPSPWISGLPKTEPPGATRSRPGCKNPPQPLSEAPLVRVRSSPQRETQSGQISTLARHSLQRVHQVANGPARHAALHAPQDSAVPATLRPPPCVERLEVGAVVSDEDAPLFGRVPQLLRVGYSSVAAPNLVDGDGVHAAGAQALRDALAHVLVEQEA